MKLFKVCPFCGGEARLVKCIFNKYTVECEACLAIMPKTYKTIAEAINNWNSYWW